MLNHLGDRKNSLDNIELQLKIVHKKVHKKSIFNKIQLTNNKTNQDNKLNYSKKMKEMKEYNN